LRDVKAIKIPNRTITSPIHLGSFAEFFKFNYSTCTFYLFDLLFFIIFSNSTLYFMIKHQSKTITIFPD